MRKHFLPAVLVIAALLAGNVIVMLDSASAMPDTKKSKPPFIEKVAGQIPSVYGDLVNVAGSNRNYILTFKDDDGTLRIIEVQSGGKLPKHVTVIKRKY